MNPLKSIAGALLAASAGLAGASTVQTTPFTLWVTETPAGGTAQYNNQLQGGVRSYVFDGLGYTAANISAGATLAAGGFNDPSSVLADAAGNLYVSDRGFNSGIGSVSKVTFTNGVANAPTVALTGLPTGPHQAALSGDGLIVSSLSSGGALYPLAGGAPTQTFASGTERGAAVGGDLLYSTAAGGTLQVFNTGTGGLTSNFNVAGASLLHYATLYGGSLWLADIGSNVSGAGGGIYKVTLDANGLPTGSSKVASADGAISVAFSPLGDEMIVATHFSGQLVGFALNGGNVAANSNFLLDGGTLASWAGAHVQYGGTAVLAAVPEPGSLALLLAGLGAVAGVARRRS